MTRNLLLILIALFPLRASAQQEAINPDDYWRNVFVYMVADKHWNDFSRYVKSQPEIPEKDALPNDDWRNSMEKLQPSSFCLVYSFTSKEQRRRFMSRVLNSDGMPDVVEQEQMKGQLRDGGSDFYDYGIVGNDGQVRGAEPDELTGGHKRTKSGTFRVPDNGCILFMPEPGTACKIDKQIGIELSHTSRTMNVYVQTLGEVMEEVQVSEAVKYVEPKRNTNLRTADSKTFRYPFEVDSTLASTNARLIIQPVAYEISEEEGDFNHLFQPMTPMVLDGAAFRRSQLKRKGFDLDNNDPLERFVDHSKYMETGKRDTMLYEGIIRPIREGYHYPVWMRVQYRNHNGAYHTDSILADDGRDMYPLKFVKLANSSMEPIVAKRYEVKGRSLKSQEVDNYQLRFRVNSATLDPANEQDAPGFVEIEKAAKKLLDIKRNNELKKVVITGYASPEGDEQGNISLARRRAEFFRQMLLEGHPEYDIELATPVVQPWSVVADTLEQLGYTAEAEQVRAIIKAVPGSMTAQYHAIRQLPAYSTLIHRTDTFDILSRLRVDAMQVDYTLYRLRSKAEVVKMYEDDPEPFVNGTGVQKYEYYYLFEHFENEPSKLAPIAKRAYLKFRDDFGKVPKDKNRPWTLAAYYYARSIYDDGGVDTTILDSRYIAPIPNRNLWFLFDPEVTSPSDVGNNPVNEPAVVLLQIMMFMRARQSGRALDLMQYCYGENRNPVLALYLKCLEKTELCYEEATIKKLAATSTWNEVAIYAAQHPDMNPTMSKTYLNLAWGIIKHDTVTFRRDNAEVQYMLAMLRYQLAAQSGKLKFNLREEVPERYFEYNEEDEDNSWGHPITEAMRLDKSEGHELERYLRWDGYFPYTYYTGYKKWLRKRQQKENDQNTTAHN